MIIIIMEKDNNIFTKYNSFNSGIFPIVARFEILFPDKSVK